MPRHLAGDLCQLLRGVVRQFDLVREAAWQPRIGPHQVARNGLRDPGYSEDAVSAYMTADEIDVRVALGLGSGQARVRTCDLTHGYISINADYRS